MTLKTGDERVRAGAKQLKNANKQSYAGAKQLKDADAEITTGYCFQGAFVRPETPADWEAHGLALLTSARDKNGPAIGQWYLFALDHYPHGYCKKTITSPAWRDKVGPAYQVLQKLRLDRKTVP